MKKFASILLILLLAACTPTPPTKSTMDSLAQGIGYFKDARGNCFAVLEVGKYNDMPSYSITYIPCEKAGL